MSGCSLAGIEHVAQLLVVGLQHMFCHQLLTRDQHSAGKLIQ